MSTLVKSPESKRPCASALTKESLRPVGELSALKRYLTQDAGDEACVFFSRRAQGSESRAQLSDLDPAGLPTSPEPEARACYIGICNLLGTEFLINGSQGDQHNLPSRATRGNEQGKNTGGQPAKSYANAGSRKRAFGSVQENSDLDPSEPGGSEGDRKGKRRLTEDNEQNQRLYACLFYRAYPHSRDYATGGRYERCGSRGINPVRLKEHIRRIHTKPAQCASCGLRGDHGEVKGHVSRARCTQNQNIERVDIDTTRRDKELTTRRKLTWHQVFSILFPNLQAPPELAKYFDHKCTPSAWCLERKLATFMQQTRHVFEGLLSSEEFNEMVASGNDPISGSPVLIAETAKLTAILSSAPFVANPSASATQPLMGLGNGLGSALDAAPGTLDAEPNHRIDAGLDSVTLVHQSTDFRNIPLDELSQCHAGADTVATEYGTFEGLFSSYPLETTQTPLDSLNLDDFEE